MSARTNASPATAPGQAPAGTSQPARRRLGLALLVIATAQLMVVLDASIVNVALPHIQRALGFSGEGLEWVINAYALAFGGLLLLGGRAGDLLGRRRVFVTGILLFSAASLVGGFATTQAWLLAARAVQGAGAAITAPTALALVTTTFAEGPPRNRAMGVYGAMSVTGGVVGLIAGGLLTTYASWRWVLFVNVPIGIAVALAAPRVLGETRGHRGRFDLPGAITGTGGLVALVYGLSSAATSPDGVSHWGDAKVVASLAAAVVLLAAFAAVEMRSGHALLPLRLLRSRDRSGAYLIMLCVGTALFGMLFFLTVFVQGVWGYSPLRTGVAYLPMMAAIMMMSAASAQLVTRIGARPLLLAGSATATGGMFWLSRIGEHSHYASGLLGPTLVTGPAWACCSCRCPWSRCPASRPRSPGRPLACSTPASRSAARWGWRCSARWPGPPSPTASTARLPPRPGPAIPRARPPGGCRPRSTGTRSRPGFPAGSRWQPGSCCSP